MSFIGIDLGTSFIKGAILDLDRLVLRQVSRIPFPEPLPGLPPLHYEISATRVVSATRSLIDNLLAVAPDCSGIVVCNQMSSLVLTSREGEALSNCVGWRDRRALSPDPSGESSHFEALSGMISPTERSWMGNELRPELPLSVLYWLSNQQKLPGLDAIPAGLGDFVIANLCRSAPGTEASNASASGALNLGTMDWHWEVISRLGLGELQWPQVRTLGEVVGYLDAGGKRVPCYTPVGDQQCALVGSFVSSGELWLNISTGSQVSLLSPRLEFGQYRMRPALGGGFYKTITHIPAGRSLQSLMDLLCELAKGEGIDLRDPWAYITRATEEVGETDLRVNLAFHESPCGDRGEISNVTVDNLTVGHLFLAAFRNMAENYGLCAARLSEDREWSRLVLSGGLAHRFPALRGLVSRRFGLEYRMGPQEDTLMGLLALALLFSGRASTFPQATEMLAHLGQRVEATDS